MPKNNVLFARLFKEGVYAVATHRDMGITPAQQEFADMIGKTGTKAIGTYQEGHVLPTDEHVATFVKWVAMNSSLGPEWAKALLREKGYGDAEQVLKDAFKDRLLSDTCQRRKGFLPGPKCAQYIDRPTLFQDLAEALEQGLAVINVWGFSGMGKSEAVVEFVSNYWLSNPRIAPIWITDKGLEGTTTLAKVCDEIAYQLGFKNEGVGDKEKLSKVHREMSYEHVLLIIDNYETITDTNLTRWLLSSLPRGCKAIVTSRENADPFHEEAWPVKVTGLTKPEAFKTIDARIKFLERRDGLRRPGLFDDDKQREALFRATSGNPLAIQMALANMNKTSPREVLEELRSASGKTVEELCLLLFARSWNNIENEAARHVALACYLFPKYAGGSALSETAGVARSDENGRPQRDSTFAHAIKTLVGFSLLQEEEATEKATYSQLSLIRAFLRVEIDGTYSGFAAKARERWAEWYAVFAEDIGCCWDSLDKLDRMDALGEKDNVEAVLAWAKTVSRYDFVVRITRGLSYYYYVRGNRSSESHLTLLWIEAAERLTDESEEFNALVYYINVAAKRGDTAEVERRMPRIDDLSNSAQLSEVQTARLQHAKALYLLAQAEQYKTSGDTAAASRCHADASTLWEKNLRKEDVLPPEDLNANQRWLGICQYAMGNLDRADALFAAMQREERHVRGVIAATLKRTVIALDRRDEDFAEDLLKKACRMLDGVDDGSFKAEASHLQARLSRLRGEHEDARASFTRAGQLYDRLGHAKKRDAVLEELGALSL